MENSVNVVKLIHAHSEPTRHFEVWAEHFTDKLKPHKLKNYSFKQTNNVCTVKYLWCHSEYLGPKNVLGFWAFKWMLHCL